MQTELLKLLLILLIWPGQKEATKQLSTCYVITSIALAKDNATSSYEVQDNKLSRKTCGYILHVSHCLIDEHV